MTRLPDTITLTVLSFNCWSIKWISKDRSARMRAIREKLFQDSKFDVICLQEIWDKNDFEGFQNEASAHGVFPYSHYFHSGVFGSGVCIFSQWPIEEVLFHKWQVNGYVHKITHGDWYGGKGIGLCTLNVKGYKVNVYTCHTHAEYSKDSEYLTHRVVQAFDIAQFIRSTSRGADFSVLAADLNSLPGDLCFSIIVDYANLIDSFQPSTVEYTGTYGCARNTYVKLDDPHGERIDYILYKAGSHTNVARMGYCFPLEPKIPNLSFSYSDHEAICAKFKISRLSSLLERDDDYEDKRQKKKYEESLIKAHEMCYKASRNLSQDLRWYPTVVLSCVMFLISFGIVISLFYRHLFSVYAITASVLTSVIIILFLFIYIWKRMEYNGILCAAHGMKLSLKMESRSVKS